MKNICIVSGVLLLLAIPSWWSYGFYILLRWIICVISVCVAYGFYKSNLTGWSLIFGSIAIIFNPLFPLYLSKSSWVGIDIISSFLFFITGYSTKKIS